MSAELQTVINFCLEQAGSVSLTRRASLYRGLAEICGEPKSAAKFRSLADELIAAEKHCQEFHFDLTTK